MSRTLRGAIGTGGNCLGDNCPETVVIGGNCRRGKGYSLRKDWNGGNIPGGYLLGSNCPGAIFQGWIVLEPALWHIFFLFSFNIEKSLIYLWIKFRFLYILAPIFTSAPFTMETSNGLTKIVGCKYTAHVDLANSSFLQINGTYRINVSVAARHLSSNLPNSNSIPRRSLSEEEKNFTNSNLKLFQLPDTLLETAGTYECGLEISNLPKPVLSRKSNFVPWPGWRQFYFSFIS